MGEQIPLISRDDPDFTEEEKSKGSSYSWSTPQNDESKEFDDVAAPETCLCNNCPKMESQIEQKCCKGKIARPWQTLHNARGKISL